MFLDKFSKCIDINFIKVSCFVLLFVGLCLNVICPHRMFYFEQLTLLSIYCLELLVYNRLSFSLDSLKNMVLNTKDDKVIEIFNKVLKSKMNSSYDILSYVFTVLFITSMIEFGCIEKSITGAYGAVLGSIVFYIGIQLYIKYITILKFIYNLQNINIIDYETYYPAMTKWLCRVTSIIKYVELKFVLIGSIYLLVFFVNIFSIPTEVLYNNISLLTVDLFFITFLFILAVPLLRLLRKRTLYNIIIDCKISTVQNLKNNISDKKSVDNISDYMNILNNLKNQENYPL